MLGLELCLLCSAPGKPAVTVGAVRTYKLGTMAEWSEPWSSGLESACGHWGCVLELRVKLSARAVERCAVWPCWGCEVGVLQPLLSAALWLFLLHAGYTACAEGSTRAGEATGFACRQKTFSSWKR